jgi:ubiquinone/menaquinone biosynthesis C-methylase UbiE
MNREIIAYYDRLAPTYDADRFGNSYGRFIDAQERDLLGRWLAGRERVLEIACGTGRLSNFAHVACDASQESLKLARRRHAALTVAAADATRLPFTDASFDAVFGFHLLMHLDAASVDATIAEAARVLRHDGVFIADVASATRRRMSGERTAQEAWHGNTALSVKSFRSLCARHGLRPRRMTGLMLLPIQRLPHRLRPMMMGFDRVLAAMAPPLSSYLAGCFVKR